MITRDEFERKCPNTPQIVGSMIVARQKFRQTYDGFIDNELTGPLIKTSICRKCPHLQVVKCSYYEIWECKNQPEVEMVYWKVEKEFDILPATDLCPYKLEHILSEVKNDKTS